MSTTASPATASFFTPLTADAIDNLLITEFVNAFTQAAPGSPVPSTNVGATLGSAFRAVRLLSLQLQNNLNPIQSAARLQTSSGGNVDSFCDPFLVTRLPASPASGDVTFACASPPSQQVVVPVNTIVQTGNGLQFTVIADNSQTGYNAGLGGYVIDAEANPPTVNATVVCNTAGAIGNVSAGAINTFFVTSGAAPAVQSVTNAAAFTNGSNVEQDPNYKTRFTLTVSGQKSGTNNAIAGAILGVQDNLTYSIGDLLSTTGALQVAPQTTTVGAVAIPAVNSSANFTTAGSNIFPFGAFVVVFDGSQAFYGQVTNLVSATEVAITNLATMVDGSGTIASGATILFAGSLAYFTAVVNVIGQNAGPSSALISAVDTAIGDIVAAGTTFWVIGPTLVTVTPSATIHVPSNYNTNAVQAACNAAFENYVNNIGLSPTGGSTVCALGQIYALLLSVPGVSFVEGLTLNGSTADVTADFAEQLVSASLGSTQFTMVSP